MREEKAALTKQLLELQSKYSETEKESLNGRQILHEIRKTQSSLVDINKAIKLANIEADATSKNKIRSYAFHLISSTHMNDYAEGTAREMAIKLAQEVMIDQPEHLAKFTMQEIEI